MPTKPRPEAPRIGPRVLWLIQHAPPPTPACYDSQAEWQSYLTDLAESGELPTRREDTAKWETVDGKKRRTERTVVTVIDRVPYCDDCPIGSAWQLARQQAGRCILPPKPYTKQPALFDAQTDTLHVNRERIAQEQARRKEARRVEKATAFLQALGFRVTLPPTWLG